MVQMFDSPSQLPTQVAWVYVTPVGPDIASSTQNPSQSNNSYTARCSNAGDTIWQVLWGPDGNFLATSGGNGSVRIWRISDGSLAHTLQIDDNTSTVFAIAFSADGKMIAIPTADRATAHVSIFDVDSTNLLVQLEAPLEMESKTNQPWIVHTIAFSPSGNQIAVGVNDGNVYIWNINERSFVQRFSHVGYSQSGMNLQGFSGLEGVGAIAFAPDNNTLVSVTRYAVRVWNISNGNPQTVEVLNLKKSDFYGYAFSISPDTAELATGEDNGTIKLWKISEGRLIRTLDGNVAAISSLAFSSDGNTIASGAWDGSIRLWNKSNGTQLKLLQGPSGDNNEFNGTEVSLSPDGHFLASAGWNKMLCIWNLR
jgi:WD40 repeat protein